MKFTLASVIVVKSIVEAMSAPKEGQDGRTKKFPDAEHEKLGLSVLVDKRMKSGKVRRWLSHDEVWE